MANSHTWVWFKPGFRLWAPTEEPPGPWDVRLEVWQEDNGTWSAETINEVGSGLGHHRFAGFQTVEALSDAAGDALSKALERKIAGAS